MNDTPAANPAPTAAPSAAASAGLSLSHWPEADRVELALKLDPPAEVMAAEVTAYQGGFAEQFAARSPMALGFETEAWAWRSLVYWRRQPFRRRVAG